jgi:hypothetical protein
MWKLTLSSLAYLYLSIELIFSRYDKLSDDPVRVMTQWKSKNINSILIFTLLNSFW